MSHEDVIRQKNREGVLEVIYDTASQAFVHLEHVQKSLPTLPPQCQRIFLPSVSCSMFLEHLRHVEFDIYSSKFNKKQWILPLKLWMASLKMKL